MAELWDGMITYIVQETGRKDYGLHFEVISL